MIVPCKMCGKQFKKQASQVKKTRNNFCSLSCSASYSNAKKPKRKKTKKCKKCDKKIIKKNKFCLACRPKFDDTRTIEELTYEHGFKSNRYQAIRDNARRKAKKEGILDFCVICGYSKHVMACHLKPISKFPKTATIKEVNKTSNLIGLCPNHHWELDHNLLDREGLKKVGTRGGS